MHVIKHKKERKKEVGKGGGGDHKKQRQKAKQMNNREGLHYLACNEYNVFFGEVC